LVEKQPAIAGAVSLRTRIVQLLQQGLEQLEHFGSSGNLMGDSGG
jgi:hypothetical protein